MEGLRNVAEDSKWELTIFESVYGFYRKLLRESLGEPVPLPEGLHLISLGELDQHFPDPLTRISGWLKLFDLAVTPSMLRHVLKPDVEPEIAETLLRYYARKKASNDVNRDKADFVATFLYRYPRVPGQWEKHGLTIDGAVPIPPFEIALIEILADNEQEPLAEEYMPILQEFGGLRQDIAICTSLDALTDAGIVQKGRDLKQSLGSCFYHPAALATIGPYNAALGKKLEELFRAATSHLKSFAESVKKEGGDVTAAVEGKVTVQHLAQIEEGEILKAEYAAAQEKFRRVSKVQKAVDKRKSGGRAASDDQEAPQPKRPSHTEEAPRPGAGLSNKFCAPLKPEPREDQGLQQATARAGGKFVGRAAAEIPSFDGRGSAASEAPPTSRAFFGAAAAPQAAKIYDAQLEEGKLRSVEDSIRVFVRTADPKVRQIVPMRSSNLTLTPVEADACGAEYWDEKSFRGEYARALSRIIAIGARVNTELQELRQRQNSSHLWKPHATSLIFLMDGYNTTFEQSNAVIVTAGQRGLNEKINAIRESLQKTRTRLDAAEALLRELEARS